METKEVPLTSASMHATVELVLAERASGEATLERAFASILSFIAGTVGMEEGADESLLRVKKGFEPRYREREEEGRQRLRSANGQDDSRSCARDGRLTQSRALGWQRVYAHTLAGPT